MKKLVCALLLVGTTVGLHAKGPHFTPPGHLKRHLPGKEHKQHGQHGQHGQRGQRGQRGHGFVQVTLKDLQITETQILATIEGTAVPVRMIRIGKEGKVFVKPIKLKTVSCQQCQHEYTVDNRTHTSTCPQCNAENKKSDE